MSKIYFNFIINENHNCPIKSVTIVTFMLYIISVHNNFSWILAKMLVLQVSNNCFRFCLLNAKYKMQKTNVNVTGK